MPKLEQNELAPVKIRPNIGQIPSPNIFGFVPPLKCIRLPMNFSIILAFSEDLIGVVGAPILGVLVSLGGVTGVTQVTGGVAEPSVFLSKNPRVGNLRRSFGV